MNLIEKYDHLLVNGGPAALTYVEQLESITGPDGIIFPSTFAPAKDKKAFAGGYVIDRISDDDQNICLVDSVGSQANRIEPIFDQDKLKHLIPQVSIKAGNKTVSILNAGHRTGDAIVRFSKFGELVWDAFKNYEANGSAEQLARLAPTSLVFGVWDSRGTQVKISRVFRSTIRATNVVQLSRGAQYFRTLKYVESGLIADEIDAGDEDKNPLSRDGFKDIPAFSLGGVIVKGTITREVTINLCAIRRLRVTSDDGKIDDTESLILRRYILGIALVSASFCSDAMYDLREGCQLRQKQNTEAIWQLVPFRGPNVQIETIEESAALSYASAVAKDFKVAEGSVYDFDKGVAEKWLRVKEVEQDKLRRLGPMTKLSFSDTSSPTPTPSSNPKPKPKKS